MQLVHVCPLFSSLFLPLLSLTPLLILTPSSCFRPAGDILFPAVYLISSFVLGIMQSCLKGTLAQQAGVFAPCLIHYSTSPVSGSQDFFIFLRKSSDLRPSYDSIIITGCFFVSKNHISNLSREEHALLFLLPLY